LKKTFRKILQLNLLFVIFFSCQKEEGITLDPTWFEVNTASGLRKYKAVFPKPFYPHKSYKVLLAIHGYGGSPDQLIQDYFVDSATIDNNFILLCPEGTKSSADQLASFNAGTCCGSAFSKKIDESAFLNAIITDFKSKFNIDLNYVYGTGMSNGGMLLYYVLDKVKFRAIAPVAGASKLAEGLNDLPPIQHFHSKDDPVVPFRGKGAGQVFTDVLGVAITSKKLLTCKDSSLTIGPNFELIQWKNCKSKKQVQVHLSNKGGHTWPGGKKVQVTGQTQENSINANKLMFQFFREMD
jgi:polyhydroxybutyrate depolymerase